MYCTTCGYQIHDEHNFCPNCGRSRKANAQSSQSQPEQWEYCEIVWELTRTWRIFQYPLIRFQAKAIGPNGTYIVGKTTDLRTIMNVPSGPPPYVLGSGRQGKEFYEEQREAVEGLLSQLMRDGWMIEREGRFLKISDDSSVQQWWNYALRRKVR